MPFNARARLSLAAVAVFVALAVTVPHSARAAVRPPHPLSSPVWAIAVEGADNNVWVDSTARGVQPLHLPMRPGTHPSITLLNGGYGVAYAGTDSSLHTFDSRTGGALSVHLGMMAGTSPSYARLVGTDSAVIAFQANTGALWTRSSSNLNQNLHLAMKAGTSPSVVGLSAGGYEIAYQGDDGSLHVYSSITNVASTLHLGMNRATSPAIAALPSGGFAVAIVSSRNELWTWTSGVGARNLDIALRSATSPSIAIVGGESNVAAIGSSGALLMVTTSGSSNTQITPYARSSPAIAGLSNGHFEVAYEAQSGVLHTYDSANGSIDRHVGMNAPTAPSVTG